MSVPKSETEFRGLPAINSPQFLGAVKEVLEQMIGARGEAEDRVVTVRDLTSGGMVRYLNDQDVSVTRPEEAVQPTEVPKAPRDMTTMNVYDATRLNAFNIHLHWELPEDDTISATEIWVNAGTNSRSGAVLVALVTYPYNEYVYENFDSEKHHYFWIRTVNWAGNHSTWEPTGSTDGYLVEKEAQIQETIDKVINALKGEAPALYNGGTTYAAGDMVSYVNADGWTRNYTCILATTGHAPTDTTYWKRAGIITEGEIDGESTLGVDGNMVVDGTIITRNLAADCITAEKIGADEVEADHINVSSLSAISANLGTITAGLAKSSDGKIQVDFDNKWIKVWDAAATLRVHIGYIP